MTFQLSKCKIAVLNTVRIVWHGHIFHLLYFYREGAGGHSILFAHGLAVWRTFSRRACRRVRVRP
jgi:hypothetical protein